MTIESDTLQFEGITLQPRQFAEAQFRTPFSNSERQAASLPTFVGALIVRAGLLYPSLPECPVARIRSGTITAIGPIMNGQIIIARNYLPFEVYSYVALMYLVIITGLSLLSQKLERRLSYDYRGKRS